MSLFSFVKEAGEKLLGLDDEEPEGTEVPEIKPAGANTSAAMLHLMLTKHNLAPEARAHARAHRTCRPPVACPRVGRRRPVRATERDIFSRRRIQDANSQVGELASGHRLDHQGASGISAGVATALSSAALLRADVRKERVINPLCERGRPVSLHTRAPRSYFRYTFNSKINFATKKFIFANCKMIKGELKSLGCCF